MSNPNVFEDEKERINLETQITYLVEDSIRDIIKKHPEMQKDPSKRLFMTKIRYFVPSFDIAFIRAKGNIEPLVFEDFEFDSTEEIANDLYVHKKPVHFRDEKKLNINLKENGFVKDVRERLKEYGNIKKENFDRSEDYEKEIGNTFLEWVKNKDNVEELIKDKWYKYKNSFNKFEVSELIEQVIPMVKHVFIRRIRCQEITNYIQENYKEYGQYFNSELTNYVIESESKKKDNRSIKETILEMSNIIDIKSQIAAAVNWFENESQGFYKKRIYDRYPEVKKSFFNGWGTNQNIILIDILPQYCATDVGEGCHGTTIKIASFRDLNTEFNRIQGFRLFGDDSELDGNSLAMNNPKEYKKVAARLRESFFEALIGRKYLIQGRDVLDETYSGLIKRIHLNPSEEDKLQLTTEIVGEKFLKSIFYKMKYVEAKEKNRRLYAAFMMSNPDKK